MTTTQVRVRWSNGQVDSAPTWEALLEKLRLTQWHNWDEEDFRLVLGKRALRWSGTEINTDLPAEFLFIELERARLVEILRDTDDNEEV